MKRSILWSVMIGGVLAVATLCIAAASPRASGDSAEVEQLRTEIAILRERVESLEKRFDDQLFAISKGLVLSPPTIDPNSPGSRAVPGNWKRFHFNGMPYYVIPIDRSACPAPGR